MPGPATRRRSRSIRKERGRRLISKSDSPGTSPLAHNVEKKVGGKTSTTYEGRTLGDNDTVFIKPDTDSIEYTGDSFPGAVDYAGIGDVTVTGPPLRQTKILHNPNFSSRSIATYQLSTVLLSEDDTPIPATVRRTFNGEAIREGGSGQFMAAAPGKLLSDRSIATVSYSPSKVSREFLEDILNLQVIDYISGQTDRNRSNLFVDREDDVLSALTAIDSDTSFGSANLGTELGDKYTFNAWGFNWFPGLPKFITPAMRTSLLTNTSAIIKSINEQTLTPTEKLRAIERLSTLIQGLNDIQTVTEVPESKKAFKKLGPYFSFIGDRLFDHTEEEASEPLSSSPSDHERDAVGPATAFAAAAEQDAREKAIENLTDEEQEKRKNLTGEEATARQVLMRDLALGFLRETGGPAIRPATPKTGLLPMPNAPHLREQTSAATPPATPAAPPGTPANPLPPVVSTGPQTAAPTIATALGTRATTSRPISSHNSIPSPTN